MRFGDDPESSNYVDDTGRSVGFGIGIHGTGQKAWNGVHKLTDWTAGCIALDDAEIDELSNMVKDGTKIVITD